MRENWATLTELSKTFGISKTTLHEWLRAGQADRWEIGGRVLYSVVDAQRIVSKRLEARKLLHSIGGKR